MISSRTPEGWRGRCDVCGYEIRVEPSGAPTRDAPCPNCGCLAWFVESDELRVPLGAFDGAIDEWEAAGRPSRLVIDFADVSFFDSVVLGKLILAHMRLTKLNARLRVCNLSPDIRSVFELTKLLDLLSDD